MQLNKVEGNELFRQILEVGLDPIEFTMETNARWPGIIHFPSGSYFRVKLSNWTMKFLVRKLVGNGRISYQRGLAWADVIKSAAGWCGEVKEPDLWAELQHAKEVFSAAQRQDAENSSFSDDEQEDIATELKKVKEYVKQTYSLSSEQVSRIEVRLDEAAKASGRLGRKDWVLLFSGTILTLIATDLVSPDVAHHIFVMALHGLSHLFGMGNNPIHELPQR